MIQYLILHVLPTERRPHFDREDCERGRMVHETLRSKTKTKRYEAVRSGICRTKDGAGQMVSNLVRAPGNAMSQPRYPIYQPALIKDDNNFTSSAILSTTVHSNFVHNVVQSAASFDRCPSWLSLALPLENRHGECPGPLGRRELVTGQCRN